jgi:hypothetical protein
MSGILVLRMRGNYSSGERMWFRSLGCSDSMTGEPFDSIGAFVPPIRRHGRHG